MALIYCPVDLPSHEQVECENYFPGGISEYIVFHGDATTTDYTDAGQINADLTAGRATHIKGIFGGLDEPAEKVQNNPIDNTEVLLGFNFVFSNSDWNATASNVIFYDELNFFLAESVLVFEPLNDGIGRTSLLISGNGAPLRFKAKRTKPVSDAEFDAYAVQAMWVNKDHPQILDIPGGIFNQPV